jgi:hypothetical protein
MQSWASKISTPPPPRNDQCDSENGVCRHPSNVFVNVFTFICYRCVREWGGGGHPSNVCVYVCIYIYI